MSEASNTPKRRLWRWLLRRPKPLPASGRYTSLGRPAALSQAALDEMSAKHHPYIVGLFAELPEPFTDFSNHDDWLHVARLVFPQVYRQVAASGVSGTPIKSAPVFAGSPTRSGGSPEGNDGDAGAA